VVSRKSEEFIREERRKTVSANILGGRSYRQIAEALGVSHGTVGNDVRILLRRWKREQLQNMEEWVLLALVRLDQMLQAVWPGVLKGDPQMIALALRIEERRAKLLGLDAPERHEHSGAGGREIVFSLYDP
jgi:hypothetical protein